MPKKSASARGGTQRNRPKVQKNIELVRPADVSEESAIETSEGDNESEATASAAVATSVDTMEAPKAKSSSSTRTRVRSRSANASNGNETALLATSTTKKPEKEAEEKGTVPAAAAVETEVATPKSAAARLAARRQGNQRNAQRTAPTLITAEHYSYVRRDLAFIAVLASIMFGAIIVLHFIPGIGS